MFKDFSETDPTHFYLQSQGTLSLTQEREVVHTTTGLSKSNVSPNLAPYATKTPHRELRGVVVTSDYGVLTFVVASSMPRRHRLDQPWRIV